MLRRPSTRRRPSAALEDVEDARPPARLRHRPEAVHSEGSTTRTVGTSTAMAVVSDVRARAARFRCVAEAPGPAGPGGFALLGTAAAASPASLRDSAFLFSIASLDRVYRRLRSRELDVRLARGPPGERRWRQALRCASFLYSSSAYRSVMPAM